MSDHEERYMHEAIMLVNGIYGNAASPGWYSDLHCEIAAALRTAEASAARRCAEIAENRVVGSALPQRHIHNAACERIAAAIRAEFGIGEEDGHAEDCAIDAALAAPAPEADPALDELRRAVADAFAAWCYEGADLQLEAAMYRLRDLIDPGAAPEAEPAEDAEGCPWCHGTGRKPIAWKELDARGAPIVTAWAPCPACAGGSQP